MLARLMCHRRCRVTWCDLNGIEHTVEVTADSLYEAVARGLKIFRDAEWAGELGHGQTKIRIVVKQPELDRSSSE